ncbi:UNVERIFIED_CONTAM: Solute carrier family 35 member F4 [Trichonephila clavipes]
MKATDMSQVYFTWKNEDVYDDVVSMMGPNQTVPWAQMTVLAICLILFRLIMEKWMPLPQRGGTSACWSAEVGNVLGNFDIAHNYDIFLKLGMLAAVPVSAVLDVHMHNVVFEGMKLAGILLISIGFMLVLLPDNWPDYITRLIRWRCRKCPKSNKPADTSQPKSRHIFMRPS